MEKLYGKKIAAIITLTLLILVVSLFSMQIPEVKATVGSNHVISAQYYRAFIYDDHDTDPWPFKNLGDWTFKITAATGAYQQTGERAVDDDEYEDFSITVNWLIGGSTNFVCWAGEHDDWGWDYTSSVIVNVAFPGTALNQWVTSSTQAGDVTHYYRYIVYNSYPVLGSIAGPGSGFRGISYTFTTSATDSNGDSVTYEWKVDGVAQWSTGSSMSYTFANSATIGTHTISARARDALGAYSAFAYKTFILLASPSLSVTSPNGGESWIRGTTQTIRWTSTGDPGAYVKIEVLKSGAPYVMINSGASNILFYSWAIPSTFALGSDYRIRITSTSNPSITDSSDSDFAITDGGTGKLTVTSPNGGESWKRGTTHAITWTSTGSVGATVKIELLKGGVVKGTISTANDGSYSWTIGMSHLGTDYRIRITSTSNPSITDSSDNNFAITT